MYNANQQVDIYRTKITSLLEKNINLRREVEELLLADELREERISIVRQNCLDAITVIKKDLITLEIRDRMKASRIDQLEREVAYWKGISYRGRVGYP
jgi:hypothetical protein